MLFWEAQYFGSTCSFVRILQMPFSFHYSSSLSFPLFHILITFFSSSYPYLCSGAFSKLFRRWWVIVSFDFWCCVGLYDGQMGAFWRNLLLATSRSPPRCAFPSPKQLVRKNLGEVGTAIHQNWRSSCMEYLLIIAWYFLLVYPE